MDYELGEFAMWLAVGFGFLGFWFGPIAKAIGRWIESKTGGGISKQRVQELEARLAELEQVALRTPAQGVPVERLAELEERLDFAERLLAQGERKPAQLG
jgi:hypothetical protein